MSDNTFTSFRATLNSLAANSKDPDVANRIRRFAQELEQFLNRMQDNRTIAETTSYLELSSQIDRLRLNINSLVGKIEEVQGLVEVDTVNVGALSNRLDQMQVIMERHITTSHQERQELIALVKSIMGDEEVGTEDV